MADTTLPVTTALAGGLPATLTAVVVPRGHAGPGHDASSPYRGVRDDRFRDGRAAAATALARLGRTGAVGVGPLRAPVWPAGVAGSISHARRCSIAVVAAAEDVPAVGVDIEDDRDTDGIAPHVLDDVERRWLRALAPTTAARRRLLLAAFSAKEAVYKALFPTVGTVFGFDAVRLAPVADGFVAEVVTPLHPLVPAGRTVSVHTAWFDDVVRSWTVLGAA